MESQQGSRMSNPSFSLIIFSIYSGIMGVILLFVPRIVLPLLKGKEEINAYTFMLGFVLLCSSFYYLASGIAKNRHFAKLTVFTRLASPIVTGVLFASGNAPLNFFVLSIVDCMGGLWTLWTLQRTSHVPAVSSAH